MNYNYTDRTKKMLSRKSLEDYLEPSMADMDYESPIKIITDNWNMQMEGEIYRAVRRIGVNVDKEELMKALQYDRDQYRKGYHDGLSVNKWIPCDVRLPEEDGYYLVTMKLWVGSYVTVHSFHGGEWHLAPDDCPVLAWQPLPAPYEEV